MPDSAELARSIVAIQKDKTFPLLHIAGETVDGKARMILSENGFTLTSWSVYKTREAEDLSPQTKTALSRGDIGAAGNGLNVRMSLILIFSQ